MQRRISRCNGQDSALPKGLEGSRCGRSARFTWLAALAVVLPLSIVSPGEAKYGAGDGTVDTPYLLYTAEHMHALAADANDWGRHFKLMADIDMTDVPQADWHGIGDEAIAFGGTFDGAGKSILHLTCIRPAGDGVGLFGHVRGNDAEIRNVCLVDPYVDAGTGESIGALVGRAKSGTIRNCHIAQARVLGGTAVGALVGWNEGRILECSVSGEIRGNYSVGGLVGINGWRGEIRNCSADVRVTGVNRVGGLVGGCILATIHWCATQGQIEGHSSVGGLVGSSDGSIITNCYSTMSVTGISSVGGLMGCNALSCECSIGVEPGQIHHCYSTGRVSGDTDTGGLVGLNEEGCLVESSFWDVETSRLMHSPGGIGLTTAQLQTPRTFLDAGWDLQPTDSGKDFWVMREQAGYPRPAWQLIEGDFDSDGNVDLTDFSVLALHWSGPAVPFWSGGIDLTADDRIDWRDVAVLGRRWLAGKRISRPIAAK